MLLLLIMSRLNIRYRLLYIVDYYLFPKALKAVLVLFVELIISREFLFPEISREREFWKRYPQHNNLETNVQWESNTRPFERECKIYLASYLATRSLRSNLL